MAPSANMKTSRYRSLFLLASILAQPLTIRASPFPSDLFSAILVPRQACENPCGFYGQVCCRAGEECYTDSNSQAACRAGTGRSGGQWEYWTTTYVQTDLVTITSIGSRLITSPTPASNAQCRATLGESPCGNTCCSAAQACSSGVCVEAGGSPIDTAGPAPTAPFRPTSTLGVTVTASATVPFIPAVGTDGPVPPIVGSGGGLSGGAIAGIVIGSLAGAFLLILLCLCFCAGGLLNKLLGILGLRGGSRSSSYTGSSRSSPPGRTWWGHGGGRRSSSSRSSGAKPGGLFGLGSKTTAGLVLAALAVCLGLRKKKGGRSEKSDSRYGSTYYTGSYSSSSSSSSSHG